MVIPRMRARVVCTLCEMMLTFEPTSALSSVDLPALGAPIRATKPQCVLVSCPPSCAFGSAIKLVRRHTDTREHGGGGGLFGSAFGISQTFSRRPVRQYDGDTELRIVMRTRPRKLAIGRRRQAARLCPFLQHGFRIAQRTQRFEHALFPEKRMLKPLRPLDRKSTRLNSSH